MKKLIVLVTVSMLVSVAFGMGGKPVAAPEADTAPAVSEVIAEMQEVKVETPVVEVEAPKVKVEAPAVEVEVPEVKVEAPAAEIKMPEVKVEAPAAPPIEVPEIKVEPPAVPEAKDCPASTAEAKDEACAVKEKAAACEGSVCPLEEVKKAAPEAKAATACEDNVCPLGEVEEAAATEI